MSCQLEEALGNKSRVSSRKGEDMKWYEAVFIDYVYSVYKTAPTLIYGEPFVIEESYVIKLQEQYGDRFKILGEVDEPR